MAVSFAFPPDAAGPGPFGGAGVFNLSTWPLSTQGEIKLWARQSTPGDPWLTPTADPAYDTTFATTIVVPDAYFVPGGTSNLPAGAVLHYIIAARSRTTPPATGTWYSLQFGGFAYLASGGYVAGSAYYGPGATYSGLPAVPPDAFVLDVTFTFANPSGWNAAQQAEGTVIVNGGTSIGYGVDALSDPAVVASVSGFTVPALPKRLG